MTNRKFVACLVLAKLAHGVQAQTNADASATSCRIVAEAKLPMREFHGHFITTVSINNQPVPMMIDTGASHTVLSPRFADMAGLAQDMNQSVHNSGIGGRTASQHPRVVHSIKFGPIALQDYDLPTGNIVPADQEADPTSPVGLLGTDLLAKYDVELDFPNRRMTLYSISSCEGHFVPWTGEYQAFQPTRTDKNLLVIPIVLNGHTMRATIDTGSNRTSVTREATLDAGVDATALDQDPASLMTGANGVNVHTHRFDTMTVDRTTFRNASVLVQDAELPPYMDMLLGMDFLHWRKLWISYATTQVFMQAPPNQAPRGDSTAVQASKKLSALP